MLLFLNVYGVFVSMFIGVFMSVPCLITASGYPLALNICLRCSISYHFVLPSHTFSALCLRHWMMPLLTLAGWLESKLMYRSVCVFLR